MCRGGELTAISQIYSRSRNLTAPYRLPGIQEDLASTARMFSLHLLTFGCGNQTTAERAWSSENRQRHQSHSRKRQRTRRRENSERASPTCARDRTQAQGRSSN